MIEPRTVFMESGELSWFVIRYGQIPGTGQPGIVVFGSGLARHTSKVLFIMSVVRSLDSFTSLASILFKCHLLPCLALTSVVLQP
jgi:hypothetical protein